jgi:hypothetical protein
MTTSDDFRKYAKKTGLLRDEPWTEESLEKAYLRNIEENCPPAHQFTHALNKSGERAIRRVYRHYVGVEWESPENILHSTIQEMFNEFFCSMAEAYASGFIVGRGDHPLTQGLQTEKDWHDLANNEDFRAEALCLAADYESDQELRGLFFEYFKTTCLDLGQRTAFMGIPTHVAGFAPLVHKVWDLYRYVHQAISANIFATGYEFGKDKAIADTLAGIMLRTAEEEE